jgi:hypothetical protein
MVLPRIASGLLAALACTLLPQQASADVTLPPVLSSHMVLQRDAAVPVWGTAAAGEEVTVKFRDQTRTATADKDGKWLVKLDALKAGGPDPLTVAGKNTLALDDVLAGEVWVGSGQSNMAGTVGGYAKGDDVLAKLATGSYPKIRLSKSGRAWQETSDKTVNSHSAILFAFGVRLQKELDVPVGLMVGAVGGTPSGFWLSDAAYRNDEACKAVVKKFAATYDLDKAKKEYEEKLVAWEKAAEQAKKDGKNPPGKPQAPVAHIRRLHQKRLLVGGRPDLVSRNLGGIRKVFVAVRPVQHAREARERERLPLNRHRARVERTSHLTFINGNVRRVDPGKQVCRHAAGFDSSRLCGRFGHV